MYVGTRPPGRRRGGVPAPRRARRLQIDVPRIKAQVAERSETLHRIRSEVGKVLVGQEPMVSRLLVGLLTGGHVLLEGVPGLAKTTAIKTLAGAVDAPFRRIQFTPDLLPADLIGTLVFNPREGTFTTRKGPIFSTFVLADEINRAPSKVQSALLEAMQERQVTIGEQSFALDPLFLVLATQNPIEQEGTYPLPEAQVDRFMLKVKIGYPRVDEERKVVDLALDRRGAAVKPVATPADLLAMRDVVELVYLDEKVKDYALSLVQATRDPGRFGLKELQPLIAFGASPRASIHLAVGARALAFLEGARLRHATGGEGHRAPRAPPPQPALLRGRGRGDRLRPGDRPAPRGRAGALSGARRQARRCAP